MFSTAAQNWRKERITIGMQTSAFNGATNNQLILQTFALASNKSSELVQIANELNYAIVLKALNDDQSEILLITGNQSFTGDTDYRGFNLASKLHADQFKGILRLQSLFGTVEERPFNIMHETDKNEYHLGIINLKSFPLKDVEADFSFFGFSEQERNQFNNTVTYVNAYWAACHYLDRLIAEAEKNEDDILESVERTFVFWDKIRKGIKLGESIQYTIQQAQIKESEEQLLTKLEKSVRLATRYETLLMSALGKRHNDPNLTASISRYYIESLKADQDKVHQNDFRDSDFLMQVTRLQFDENLALIFEKISPKSDKGLAAALTLGGLVHLADEHFQKSDLANALIFYEDARTMNRHYDFVEDSAQITERIDAAKLRLLQSHLKVAAKAVETGNSKLANDYKEKSNAFIKEKIDEHLVNQLPEQSDELVESYIRKGNLYLDQQLYQQAIKEFENAASTAKNFFNIRHTEQINHGLFAAHHAIFTGLIQDAENMWTNSRKDDAHKRLQQAIDYRQDHIDYLRNSSEAFHLKSKMNQNMAMGATMHNGLNGESVFSYSGNTIFDPAMIADTKTLILDQLRNAQLKAWGNAIDEAWELYGNALEGRKQFGLETDPDIARAMSELDSRMIDRICLNNKFRLEELMERVRREINSNQPDRLRPMLEEIIEIGTNNQGCMLKFEEAKQLHAFYLPYFNYLDDYKSIIDIIYSKGLKEAIPVYMAFDKNLQNYHLDRFGISHVSLVQFIQKQNNVVMTLQAIDFFVDQMQLAEVTVLLMHLRGQDFSRDQTYELQQKAGTFLAVAHWNVGALNAEFQIEKITANDRRLSVLQRSYLQAAKAIKKQNR